MSHVFTSMRVLTRSDNLMLATLEQVQNTICVGDDNTDDYVIGLIVAASERIAAFLNIEMDQFGRSTLAIETIEEIHHLRNGDIGPIELRRQPVTELSSISEDGAVIDAFIVDPETGATIDNPAFQYIVDSPAGLLWKTDQNDARAAFTATVVKVTYKAGYVTGPENSTVPGYLQDACISLIRRLDEMLNPDETGQIKSESVPGVISTTYETTRQRWAGGLPDDIASLLAPHCRVHV